MTSQSPQEVWPITSPESAPTREPEVASATPPRRHRPRKVQTVTAPDESASKPSTVLVFARAKGFYGNLLRNPGEEFAMDYRDVHPEKPSWIEVVRDGNPPSTERLVRTDDPDAPVPFSQAKVSTFAGSVI